MTRIKSASVGPSMLLLTVIFLATPVFSLLPTEKIINFYEQYLVSIFQQPEASSPNKEVELRPLKWGQLNFIHTTDIHGRYHNLFY